MSNPWPGSVPRRQALGLTVEPAPGGLVRSTVDSGPPQTRPRFTADVEHFDVPVTGWTGAELQAFQAWYRDVLKRGALPFLWDHPVTDVEVTMKFRDRPRFGLEAGGTKDTRLWRGVLPIEVLP